MSGWMRFENMFGAYAVLVGVHNVRLIEVDVSIVVPAVSMITDVSVTNGRKNCEQKLSTSSVTFSGLNFQPFVPRPGS